MPVCAKLRYQVITTEAGGQLGSHEEPTYASGGVMPSLRICSIIVFFAGLLALGATLVYGPVVWLAFAIVALAITALVKGW